MTRSRFEAIKSNFSIYDVDNNFTKNDSTLADKAILYFNSVFGSKYSLGRDLSIDEGICSWKGKLRFKTYTPQKPDKYGIKLYMLCDSKTGYTLKFTLCSGGKTINETVYDLLDNYFRKHNIIYMDNYYNSIKLTEKLHEKHVYLCGTLRTNKDTSRAFEVKFSELKKDQICYEVNENDIVENYFERKQIRFITSFYELKSILTSKLVKATKIEKKIKTITYVRKNKEMPLALKKHNKYMEEVDLCDQMTKYYSTATNAQFWIRKIAFNF
ncbi:PiggyBac transposable element-derived protein 4 [Cucumispora dikerogammari]|nr:PiggyBac transposable element-derived protein 4 [Cucumispora dikerogammari]